MTVFYPLIAKKLKSSTC